MWLALLFFLMSLVTSYIMWNALRYVGKERPHGPWDSDRGVYGFPWGGIVINVVFVLLTIMALTDTLYFAGHIAGLIFIGLAYAGGVVLVIGIVGLVLWTIVVLIVGIFFIGPEFLTPRVQKVSARANQLWLEAKEKTNRKPKEKRKNEWL